MILSLLFFFSFSKLNSQSVWSLQCWIGRKAADGGPTSAKVAENNVKTGQWTVDLSLPMKFAPSIQLVYKLIWLQKAFTHAVKDSVVYLILEIFNYKIVMYSWSEQLRVKVKYTPKPTVAQTYM